MELLGKLAILWAVTLAAGQAYNGQQEVQQSEPTLDYEQLTKLIQSPLFRSNPVPSSSEEMSSYLPISYDATEPKQISDEPNVSLPSLVLEAPKLGAIDSYNNPKSVPESSQIYQSYQPNPYLQPKPVYVQEVYSPDAIKLINFTPQDATKEVLLQQYLPLNPLSKQLDLPLPNTPAKPFSYPPVPSTELQTPNFGPYNQQFNTKVNQYNEQYPVQNILAKNLETPYPTLSQTLELPKSESIKPTQLPTNFYPKKYNSNVHEHKPKKAGKNIPLIELVGDDVIEVTNINKASKPQKLIYAPEDSQSESFLRNQAQEKQRQKFEEAQKKKQINKDNESRKQQRFVDATLARAKGEQVASETGFNSYHGGSSFAAPVEQSADVGLGDVSHGAGGDRTVFQMHGQHGPHSYKFGYDTGKGKNRHFRYEERDNDGYVKGHYGFYDKHGKLQVVNYDAHPHHGFHAEGSFGRA